ncbi:TRAP transporter small permease [Acuticoccus yangtzensis]|uniref:TRAP transporter small permease n=1 Tax=Acuticoccus yangtzensis TaxID=1443441 RepID=UPI000949A786|nr:TRAP transporter small permease [Acuticoccus yangtzensis]ORE90921.1 C4-dicarboxylate transport system permease small protein [Stappia sp. 22II-S9-Z10]
MPAPLLTGGPRWLSGLERGLAAGIGVATVLTGATLIFSLIIGVFYRYVLQASLSWTDEVAMLCFSWSVFLAAPILVRDNAHVRVEIIESLLPAPVFRVLDMLIWIAIAVTGGYMVWAGWAFMTLTFGQTSPAVRYPLWVRNLSLPVSGGLIAVYALLRLLASARGDRPADRTELAA